MPKLIDSQRHYHTTTKTTPTNAEANPKSTRNKKNIQLELKAAVMKKAVNKSTGKEKRTYSDKEMALSTVHTKC